MPTVVVDDDADTMQVLHDALELENIRCVGVSDAHQVRPLVRSIQPDLLLVDLLLQQASGIELAQELRGSGVSSPTPSCSSPGMGGAGAGPTGSQISSRVPILSPPASYTAMPRFMSARSVTTIGLLTYSSRPWITAGGWVTSTAVNGSRIL